MMGEYDAGYENYIDSLIREIGKLQDENDKLREQVSSLVGRSFRTADKMSCIEDDNAKLRGLLEAVLQCAGETKRDKGCDACPMYNGPWRNDGTWCLLRPTLRELGVEADGG